MSNSSSSSVVVLFRAFVMLAFLIGVPALALMNTNVSDVLRQLAERHLGITFHGSSANNNALSEAPLYAGNPGPAPIGPGTAPPNPGTLAPPVISLPAPTGTPPASLTNPTPPLGQLATAPATNENAPGMPNSAAPMAPASPIQPTGFVAPSPLPGAPVDPGVAPAVYQAPSDPRGTLTPASPFANSAARDPAESGEPVRRIQQRLRELGATYVLLESFGNQGLYRFYCKMAMGGNANYTRYFEATDSDPVHAMNTVLQQVESWRNGR